MSCFWQRLNWSACTQWCSVTPNICTCIWELVCTCSINCYHRCFFLINKFILNGVQCFSCSGYPVIYVCILSSIGICSYHQIFTLVNLISSHSIKLLFFSDIPLLASSILILIMSFIRVLCQICILFCRSSRNIIYKFTFWYVEHFQDLTCNFFNLCINSFIILSMKILNVIAHFTSFRAL